MVEKQPPGTGTGERRGWCGVPRRRRARRCGVGADGEAMLLGAAVLRGFDGPLDEGRDVELRQRAGVPAPRETREGEAEPERKAGTMTEHPPLA